METINNFRGKYAFLSNFYPSRIDFEGMTYAAVEDAFQAAKTLDVNERRKFTLMPSPAEAKRYGRKVKLRSDWEDVKISVMYEALNQKFKIPELRKKLLDTEDAYLEEGNHHGDKFWGTVNGDGKNMLGKLLMEVRKQIKLQEEC